MIVKMLVQRIIISIISVYVQQRGLDESQKDGFYDSLIKDVGNLGEEEIVIITGDFNGHVDSNPEN